MENWIYQNAYFTDVDKSVIRIEWLDGKELVEETIPFDENFHRYQELINHITLDQLYENTHNKNKEQRKLFEEMVFSMAEREGLIEHKTQSNDIDVFMDCILKYTEDKEFLFKLKLKMFELDKLKESSNRTAKSQLRKAQTIVDTLNAFDKF